MINEPMYHRGGAYSFFIDSALAQTGNLGARDRLDKHAKEVQALLREDTPIGAEVRRQARELTRVDNPLAHEVAYRSMSSSTAAGFVTPQYIIEDWAQYRTPTRAFVDQCNEFPLPEYGLAINIPSFTGPSNEAQFTENATVVETDMTGAVETQPVVTVAGQVGISQQLNDRGMAGTGTMNDVVAAQLHRNYDTALDQYVINTVATAGAQVTGGATWSWGQFYTDLALSREKLTDTAGTRLMPTHIFTTSDFYSYITRQLDAQNRPMILPQFAPGTPLVPGEDPDDWVNFTGVIMPGYLRWFIDDNIPASGSNTRIFIARPEEVYVFESEPVVRSFVATQAQNLTVTVQLYGYIAVVPRYPNAVAQIIGNAYTTSLL